MSKTTYLMRDLVAYYIGGGWGKEEPMAGFPESAYVVRGTDIPDLRVANASGVPYRYHSTSNLRSRRLQAGDIVMEVSGGSKDQPVGRSLLITPAVLAEFDDDVMCASFCKLVRPDTDLVDPAYLYWHLQRIYDNREILQYQVQSTGISNFQFEAFLDQHEVELPPLPVQRRIGGILSAYDDLIENNTRRIRLLEEMARALYREWFVHYRFPGHEDVEMVGHADLGEVPEGWEVRGFSELAKFVNGFAFKPSHQEDTGLPIVKIPELRDGVTGTTPRNSGAEIKPKYHISEGDLLFSWSGSFVVTIWTHGPALLNQHLFRVIDYHPSRKYYLLIALQESIGDFLTLATGATMQHIRRSALSEVKLAVPPGPVRDRFHVIAEPLFEQIVCLRKMNENLRQTRDLLLPRLVSGDIPVVAAEEELEAAA
jgi:type I restriction enzyme, S subunit